MVVFTTGYDAIIITVSHEEFLMMGIEEIKTFGKKNCVIFDVKAMFDQNLVDLQL